MIGAGVRPWGILCLTLTSLFFQNCGNLDSPTGTAGAGQFSSVAADTTAPEFFFQRVPPSVGPASSAVVAFFSDDPEAVFECALNNSLFQSCESPLSFSGLGDGNYQLQVRATDASGNSSPLAYIDWRIDQQAPTVIISSTIPAYNKSRNLSIAFSGSPDLTGFECRVDSAAYAPCASPLLLANLADGKHTILIRGSDAAGNRSMPATLTFVVDTVAPVVSITAGPLGFKSVGTASSATAEFSFTVQDGGGVKSVSCTLDAGARTLQPCASPARFLNVAAQGLQHTFEVTAVDNAGNVTKVTRAFSFFTQAPHDR